MSIEARSRNVVTQIDKERTVSFMPFLPSGLLEKTQPPARVECKPISDPEHIWNGGDKYFRNSNPTSVRRNFATTRQTLKLAVMKYFCLIAHMGVDLGCIGSV